MSNSAKFRMKDFGARRNGLPATFVDESGKQRIIKSYDSWKSMFTRCYSHKYHKLEPTYIGCSVCDEWKSYKNFKLWHDKNYTEGYALDKDLLLDGNKVYSPEFCRYVPRYINQLICSGSRKGDLNKGVAIACGKFVARASISGVCTYIGTFDTEDGAFKAYKRKKELHAKAVAVDSFNMGLIGVDVYSALMSWSCAEKGENKKP